MSLLTKGGITRLSELTIDADKNWQAQGITNIKELALAMAQGDIVVRGPAVMQRLAPGVLGYVLTSAGPGHMPSWQPVPGALEYYIPAWVSASHSEGIATIDHSHAKNAPIDSNHVQNYVDDVANLLKMLDATVATSKAHSVVSVDRSHAKTISPGRDIAILVDGAVSETAVGVQTDETAAARSGAVDDMNLCPMTGALGDKYYLGFSLPFRRVYVYVSTAGAGNWTNQTYYWNGAWTLVADEDDQTAQFQVAATRRIDWTMPGDWVQSIIQGMNLYWIKIETTNFVNQVTKPLGATAWACPVA